MNSDKYYYGICEAVSKKSKCLSRQIGAILVVDKMVIATGYNGPPRGIPHCGVYVDGVLICPRRAKGFPSGEGLHLCPAAHAERNAIVQAARHGIKISGAILYINTNIPCFECLKEIINAGINEVVCTELTTYPDWLSGYLLEHSGIRVRTFQL